MTFDQVRRLLIREAAPYRNHKGLGIRGWCAANGVHAPHVASFMTGKRLPPADMLEALGLEWRVMRKAKR